MRKSDSKKEISKKLCAEAIVKDMLKKNCVHIRNVKKICYNIKQTFVNSPEQFMVAYK